jgi:hypothetical protein
LTLRSSVVELLRQHGPLTDAQLRRLTGARSHQHVNQVCRRLSERGVVRREAGPDGRLLNILVADPTPAQGAPRASDTAVAADPNEAQVSTVVPPLDDPGVLVVLPCSARKRTVGLGHRAEGGIDQELPPPLRRELNAARQSLRRHISVDLDSTAPAVEVYDGALYRALDRRRLLGASCSAVILSGGYGLVDVAEAIGDYDRRLNRADWPGDLLERVLVAVARSRRAHTVVAFLASSTSYADVFRGADWAGLDEVRVSMVSVASGGSTGTTPKALGEAVNANLVNPLSADAWRSSSGLRVAVSSLARSRIAPSEHVEAAVEALTRSGDARRPEELRTDQPVWARPGLYAWWVDEAGRQELSDTLGVGALPHLIYAGQTGATAWPSGRSRSSTLGQRVRGNHLRGNVQSSTFRRTLASLLVPGIDARDGEASVEPTISSWMNRHLRVAVWPYDDRDRLADLEDRVLHVIDPPLNLEGRPPSQLRVRIAARRRQLG